MVAKAADTSSVLQITVVMHTPHLGTHVLNPNCLSVMWVLSVNLIYQSLSQCPRCGGLGLLNMLFRLTITAGCCYLLSYVTVSAWSKPSENHCLHRLSNCIPEEKGRQEKRQSQSWPFSTSQRDTGNNSSRALQKGAVDAAAAWGSAWWEEFWLGGQSPPGDWCSSPAPLHVEISPAQ